MANWYGTARSNYFKVKDAEAFKVWAAQFDAIELWDDERGFGLGDTDEGYWPSSVYNDETGEDRDIDFVHELSEHLTEDSVAVLMSAGAEKLRYITGYAVAVNHKGELVEVSLDDIYELATAKFGITPTSATY